MQTFLRRLACTLLLLNCSNLSADTPPLRDLDAHCPFTPPASLDAWQARAQDLKLQLDVALGLYPSAQLNPIQPNIYGRIDRDDYTIEKLTFESLPGFFVTGNLYRPKELSADTKIPAVLCPHGHWEHARFYDASPAEINALLADGSERFESAARNHIQARCVQLARMGCIVFHWDMIGYCDNQQISFQRAHQFANQPAESENDDSGWLLFSPRAEAHSQSILGMQTLAIHRAVDMLLTLPEVDPQRIAISGASGGGTQSFLGAATDDRISLAFPAVMVSTGMQGGCTCENACLLRTGTGNVEMAALIAPRPLGMTAADDWTRTMPNDGFPELQQLYALYDAQDKVALFPAVHFKHNFNHVARVGLYGWVSDHFQLGFEKPVLERDFQIASRDELSVWDAQHPLPPSGEEFERKLMKLWAEIIDGQMRIQLEGDAAQLAELAQTLTDGWRVCLGMTTPAASTVVTLADDGAAQFRNDRLPDWQLLTTAPQPAVANTEAPKTDIAAAHAAVMQPWNDADNAIHIEVIDQGTKLDLYPLLAGETQANEQSASQHTQLQALVENPRLAAAYTYGYNLPLFAKRAQQLGLTLRHLASKHPTANIAVSGRGSQAAIAAAGVFVARSLPQEAETPANYSLRIAPGDFSFANVPSIRHPDFLPGAARFWDLPGLVACARVPVEFTESPADQSVYQQLEPVAQELDTQIKLP